MDEASKASSDGSPVQAARVRRPPSVGNAMAGKRRMPAAVLRDHGAPLQIGDLPVPEPAEEEVLVRVEAVGLCATDLKLISGALADTSQLPVIPGHEVAGVVVEDAAGDGELEGARVACYIYDTCGACRWCAADRPTLCPHAVRIGVERDGGLASHMTVRRSNALPFSNDLSCAAAAVTMDAVTSPWGALHGRARMRSGEAVVIVGCGGLGLHGVQIAVGADARVAAVDPLPSHRALALQHGAELAVAPDEVDRLMDWSAGGADVALESSGVRRGFDAAAAVVRPGGRVVCNGYQPGVEYGLDSARLVLQEIDVLGSRLSTLALCRDALAAVERGDVQPQVMEILSLTDINEALRRLSAGEVDGRLVIAP